MNTEAPLVGRHFIAGAWHDGAGQVPDINPSDTRETVGLFPAGTADLVAEAARAAQAAQPAWAATSPQIRHDVLQRIGAALNDRREEIGRVLAREEGKTLAEGIAETVRASQVFTFFAGECLRTPGEHLASLRPGVEVEITREAVGVAGVIAPWNFPIAIPAWKVAPALAYGNAVVFKPAEVVPATSLLLTRIIADSGLPAGVFNTVFGAGRVIGEAMVASSDINAISFTGSVATGRHIAKGCVTANPMKKVLTELGGKNPLVVLDDADLDVAVEVAVNGAFFSTGQRCTASSRLIVTRGIHDHFVERVVARMAQLKVGNALDPATHIGPVVDAKQLEQDLRYVALGREEGAELVTGGQRLELAEPGFYLSPALFTGVRNSMRIAQEEIFGPVAAVIQVADYEEALATANDTEFGLSSGICTTSLKYASHFKRASKAGMVMVNLPTAGVDYHAPFGGRRNSSYGAREQGRYAVEFYTTVKTAYTLPG
ncbi:MAG: aldehyde dehydrogenase family protein [Azospirillaceae bacterium]|nr:aldehyde dehydrogenase family protein [Azospirillaceae bacterium]